jgi:hypothetical protein
MTDILIPTPNAKYYNKRIKENNDFYQNEKKRVANYISNRIKNDEEYKQKNREYMKQYMKEYYHKMKSKNQELK